MNFAIFGLTVSSSWGNGHATLWRGLIRALCDAGHQVVFFERDVPYYAMSRDLHGLSDGARLVLYSDWHDVVAEARRELARADVAMVTSYCPDGPAASALALDHAGGMTIFYDLDTPVTLARLASGERPAYLPPDGLGGFDLVLSYTGGEALTRLRSDLGGRRVAPLYGHVDPRQHRPAERRQAFAADLSYLGTYADDRQAKLQAMFIEPARLRPAQRFVLAGAGYPHTFPWTENIFFVRHLPPADHAVFFSSSRLTLNVTRHDMSVLGHCPSGRLFEAAACGVPILSDVWDGLDEFFVPGREILVGSSSADALAALDRSDAELAALGAAARERVLAEHTSWHRARELVALVEALPSTLTRERGLPVA